MKINHILMTAILSLSLVTGATMAVAPATSATQIIVAQSPTETPPRHHQRSHPLQQHRAPKAHF